MGESTNTDTVPDNSIDFLHKLPTSSLWKFNGEHWKRAYDLLCGDFLSINSPLDKEGLGESVPDLQGQSSSDRSDRD